MNPQSPTSTSASSTAQQGSVQPGVSFLARMAFKMFGVVARRFDRSQSTPSTSMDPGKEAQRQNPSAIVYQQSSTRKLAFGGSVDVEADKKPMDDFYNNSTLTNVTKVFCAIILLTAFFLVMSRSFDIDFPVLS
ncbi:hypothetical protein PRIPAC_86207 [Pristionchus pacificus]|uniref:Uncharacterized protein n=1 Tax=Pristionchus pacificus TaxID=54126 RepID=A0A2A6BKZ4_PRIPA|nr:hypothetical protein PRIPAC_86207 [Pristionchus pacificus]|eukprot:PDM66518.1 hypothetical protein PRIPAC_47935 [Pristionchus pacificus]